MLTERQYERLPQILKEIVDNDQQRAAIRAPQVIPFAAVIGHAKLSTIRGELRRGAGRLWGQNLNKNAATAKRRDDDENDPFPDAVG